MTAIALTTANRVEIEESLVQHTAIAAEAITAGEPVRFDTSTGKFTGANATSAAEARVYGIAGKTVAAGMPVTVVRQGVMDGWDLSGVNFGAEVYLSDTDGRIDTAEGTINVSLGRVVSANAVTVGTTADKLLYVDIQNAEDIALDSVTTGALVATTGTFSGSVAMNGGGTVQTGDTLAVADADALTVGGVIVPQVIEVSANRVNNADQVDSSFFIANRAYQVTAIKEVHTTPESGGTCKLQVTKQTGTQAPSAGTALLTNNSNSGFLLTGTAETVQTGTLSATVGNLQLAAGDRLGLNYTDDVPGEAAGVVVTVTLKAI